MNDLLRALREPAAEDDLEEEAEEDEELVLDEHEPAWVYDDGGRGDAGFKGEAGDCAARAIAIATGRPYTEVYDALNESRQEAREARRQEAEEGQAEEEVELPNRRVDADRQALPRGRARLDVDPDDGDRHRLHGPPHRRRVARGQAGRPPLGPLRHCGRRRAARHARLLQERHQVRLRLLDAAVTDQQAKFVTATTPLGADAWVVEISFTHLPHRYTFHLIGRRKGDAVDLECDGAWIEAPGGVVRSTAVRELADNFDRYEQHARNSVLSLRGDGGEVIPRPVRRQRKLTNEFLRDIARRHASHEAAGRPPTATLAAEEGVTVGAVKNWLRKVRERGIEGTS